MEPKINFIDLNKRSRSFVPSNVVSLSWTGTTRRITFSKEATETIRDGKFIHLRVGFSEVSNEVYFVFCKEPARDSMLVNTNGSRIDINSKFLVETMVEKMGLEKCSQPLTMSDNKSNKPEYLTFVISK